MKSSQQNSFKIGDRISCVGDHGTIKYIGEIKGKEHQWLGIDWDNPERGRHNGTVNGFQYFTARYPTSGSFIRPEKVMPAGSVLESIVARYQQEEDEFTLRMMQQKQMMLQQSINAPFLEMVGFEKVFNQQSNLALLRIINLRDQNINSIGDVEELYKNCPNIEELDLSKNLFSSWEDIFILCQQFKRLQWLNISENLLQFPEEIKDFNVTHLKVLICGNMELIWEDILKISVVFTHVEEIWAPFNNITKLKSFENCLNCLKTLDLEGNQIVEWSEVCNLSAAINLEQLLLENIGLKTIRFPDGEPIFRNLKKLCLAHNLIADWESITELNKLEKLENLKIMRNPVLETENKETVHQLLIAKLENLKILNGVEIEPGERRGAEYDYLKKYGLEWLAVKNTPDQEKFIQIHPRFLQLIEKYGEMEESELIAPAKDIKSHLIELQLIYGDRVIKKKVPSMMTIQKLHTMVQKLFRLKQHFELLYISNQCSGIRIELDDDMKEIGTYSMQDGDIVIVHEL